MASRGGVHWFGEGACPPDLRVCPSRVKVKEDKVRAPHDWLNAVCPLNSALANPFVQYGTMDEFPSLTAPGAVMGDIDLQDCFLHWLAAPSRRRLLGVRHPATGFLGAYIFLLRVGTTLGAFGWYSYSRRSPSGLWLGPPPGRNDACVQALLKVARSRL